MFAFPINIISISYFVCCRCCVCVRARVVVNGSDCFAHIDSTIGIVIKSPVSLIKIFIYNIHDVIVILALFSLLQPTIFMIIAVHIIHTYMYAQLPPLPLLSSLSALFLLFFVVVFVCCVFDIFSLFFYGFPLAAQRPMFCHNTRRQISNGTETQQKKPSHNMDTRRKTHSRSAKEGAKRNACASKEWNSEKKRRA